MLEKKNDNWLKRTWSKVKTLALGSVMAASPLASSAGTTGEIFPKNLGNPTSSQNTTANENTSYTDINAADFRAYSGQYYNEICNGSLCWISSQSETNGCGIGRLKNVSSSQIWSSDGLYSGINQMDITQRKAYLNWMKDKPEYKDIYNTLKNNNTKSGWEKAAQTNEHLFIVSQENYMSSQYAPEKFKNLQKTLDKLNLGIDIRTIHPAIIGEMHKMMVQSPGAYHKIAKVTKDFLETHDSDDLNSGAYAEAIAPCVKIGWQKLAPHTIQVMNDTTINWKEEQYIAALSKVSPEKPSNETWFDKKRNEQNQENTNSASNNISLAFYQINQTSQIITNSYAQNILKPDKKLKKLTLAEIKKANARTRAAIKRKEEYTPENQPNSPESNKTLPLPKKDIVYEETINQAMTKHKEKEKS